MRLALTALGLALFVVVGSSHAERWQSPDRFYSLTVPFDWKHSENKSETTTSYAFTSPDGAAEIRISATYDLVKLPEATPDTILDPAFRDEQPITALKRIRG